MDKKLFIKTWGCQMNDYDSKRMADVLRSLGYETVSEADGADMIILNTCHIREKATDKVFSELGRLKVHKDNKKDTIMAVAGCVAQAEGDFIMKRAPYVDMVFGPQTYHLLPEMVIKATGQRVVNTDFPVEDKFDALPSENKGNGLTAFVAVQEGCDKFCTYCVVPYTRGAEYSRPVSQIIDECKRVAKEGVKEVTLLGQNVNAYHGKSSDGGVWGLGELIREIAEINGIERIRYTTSHPNDMEDSLIYAHRDVDKLMPYLHLPVQSGSDEILKAMNRKHSADSYKEIIAKFREVRPDIAISGDFIVGFPGESEQDFEDTIKIVEDIKYASAYSFKYSARPGTPAANMMNLVHDKIASDRLARLQELLNKQQLEFNQNSVGMVVPVLFDKKGRVEGQIHGRTPYNQAIHVAGNERLIGEIVDVKITQARGNSLGGEIVISETTSKQYA